MDVVILIVDVGNKRLSGFCVWEWISKTKSENDIRSSLVQNNQID